MGKRSALAAVIVGLLQLVVLVTLAYASPAHDPHAAPIRIVAPSVVATSLVDRANALPGRPVHAEALSTSQEARSSVRTGRSVAAIVVDLTADADTLYLASANGSDLNRALQRQIAEVERSFGRGVVVHDLVPARANDEGQRGVYVLTAACILIGFGVAITIAWRRGPVAPTLARGAARLGVATAISVAVGVAVGMAGSLRYDGGFAGWWLLGALTVLAATSTTMALESLFGVLGIGVATTLFVIACAPLLRLTPALLLPDPWAAITPSLPYGSSLAAGSGQAYFGGAPTRPLLVLVVWIAVSVLTLVVARHERPAAVTGRWSSVSPRGA
jgi:hypothetical protein